MSSGTLFGGLSWTRSGTTLTVTSTAHGLTTGDYVVLRGFNVDYFHVSITSTGANTFTCTVTDTGATSGTAGAYIPVLNASTISDSAIEIEAPSAGNVQLISMQVYIDNSETNPKSFTVPANALTNGAGGNSSLTSRIPPVFIAWNVAGANSSRIGTGSLTFVTGGAANVYGLSGGLDIFGSVMMTFNF